MAATRSMILALAALLACGLWNLYRQPRSEGRSQHILGLVLAVLHDQPTEISAQECADAIGVSRVSARRYLEHFVDQGSATVRLRYGSAGRPERRYAAV